MIQALKQAGSICKTITRNGYEAYVVNAPLQLQAMELSGKKEIDICTDLEKEMLCKLFPNTACSQGDSILPPNLTENGITYFFYPMETRQASYTESCISKFTPRLAEILKKHGQLLPSPFMPPTQDENDGFVSVESGHIALVGIPDETLKKDYLRAIKALRLATNFGLPLENNTFWAILRSARKVVDYVSTADIMNEWRKVEVENMWIFVKYMYETMILHGIIPELTALTRIMQPKNPKKPEEGMESAWERTLNTMRYYPEELPYDWYGTFACLFHNVGKLYAAEHFEGKTYFHQHQQIGAKISRKVTKRLQFESEEIDLICHLVRNHMRFKYMLNDKGIRRFKALDDYPRLIEMARADVKARNGNFTEFNHNMKMLDRTEVDEDLLEPLLNGKQIMELAGIKPGPEVGVIRHALLQAQIAGDVNDMSQAQAFVASYKLKEKIQ